MKTRFLLIVILGAAVACRSQPGRKPDTSIGPALQSAMDRSIGGSGVTGVSSAVLFSDGSLWKGASGFSHPGVPMTTEMLFDIGSIEKNLQAALALRLIEDGLMGLDDPLSKWLPPHPNIPGTITIRQLLNMTAGLNDFVDDANSPFRIGYYNIDFDRWLTWEDICGTYIHEPEFEAGTQCAYSSTNYIVLRQVIERASRSRQTDLFEARLRKPFRLDHTYAEFSTPIPAGLGIAHGWCDGDGDGVAEDISGRSLNWIASLSPMLVYSTPEDIVRWMDVLYHKKTVLSAEMLEAMLAFGGSVRNEPMMKGYGLGTVSLNVRALMPQWESVQAYGHLGSTFGYSTFSVYFPEYGITVAIMFNRGCDRDTDRAVMSVGGPVFDVLFRSLGAKESKRQDSISGMIEQLKKTPGDVHLMHRIAKQHQADKDDYEASLVYEEILKRDPGDTYGYRTEALFWKASYDGVIWKKPEGLISFISEHPDYRDIQNAHVFLAKTYLRRGEMDRAVQTYHDALKVFEKDAEFYNSYAWWVYENKVTTEYDTAIRHARTALEWKPDACHIWDTLAWLYFENGDQESAVEASTKALSLAPGTDRKDYEESLQKIRKGKK